MIIRLPAVLARERGSRELQRFRQTLSIVQRQVYKAVAAARQTTAPRALTLKPDALFPEFLFRHESLPTLPYLP